MERAKWFDSGNVAHGFVALGNVATGFIAIGNVARGFIAIGNLAIGVIAIGNVGVGVIGGAGATIALGMLAAATALPCGVVQHLGLEDHPLPAIVLSLVPIVAWTVLSFVMRGERSQRELPALTPLAAFRDRSVARGWVLGRIGRTATTPARAGQAHEPSVTLGVDGERISMPLTPYSEKLLDPLRGREVLAEIEPQERVRQDEVGYREGAPRELAFVCKDLRVAPVDPPIWQTPADITWALSRIWRFAAVVGALAWVARLVLVGFGD